MAPRSVDPDALAVVVRALEPLRRRVADAEDEFMGLAPEVGSAAARTAVDALVDAALDAARAVGEEARLEAYALRDAALAQARADEATVVAVRHWRGP